MVQALEQAVLDKVPITEAKVRLSGKKKKRKENSDVRDHLESLWK